MLLTLLLFLATAIMFKITRKKKNELKVGTTILITEGYKGNSDSIGKILAIDEFGGHKVYGIKIKPTGEQMFTEDKQGKKIDISTIGHLPILDTTLAKWKYTVIGSEKVEENELEGYKMWKEAKGGAF